MSGIVGQYLKTGAVEVSEQASQLSNREFGKLLKQMKAAIADPQKDVAEFAANNGVKLVDGKKLNVVQRIITRIKFALNKLFKKFSKFFAREAAPSAQALNAEQIKRFQALHDEQSTQLKKMADDIVEQKKLVKAAEPGSEAAKVAKAQLDDQAKAYGALSKQRTANGLLVSITENTQQMAQVTDDLAKQALGADDFARYQDVVKQLKDPDLAKQLVSGGELTPAMKELAEQYDTLLEKMGKFAEANPELAKPLDELEATIVSQSKRLQRIAANSPEVQAQLQSLDNIAGG